jgi:hypothetical protein
MIARAREQLIGPLAGQNHFYLLRRKPRTEPGGNRAAHRVLVERFQVIADLWKLLNYLGGGVSVFVMCGADVAGDAARRSQIPRPLHNH